MVQRPSSQRYTSSCSTALRCRRANTVCTASRARHQQDKRAILRSRTNQACFSHELHLMPLNLPTITTTKKNPKQLAPLTFSASDATALLPALLPPATNHPGRCSTLPLVLSSSSLPLSSSQPQPTELLLPPLLGGCGWAGSPTCSSFGAKHKLLNSAQLSPAGRRLSSTGAPLWDFFL